MIYFKFSCKFLGVREDLLSDYPTPPLPETFQTKMKGFTEYELQLSSKFKLNLLALALMLSLIDGSYTMSFCTFK